MTGLGTSGLALGMSSLPGFALTSGLGEGGHHAGHASLLEQCREECSNCYTVCRETLNHCLEMGAEHANPSHIRLLQDCIEICKASIEFMLNRSESAKKICALCAAICEKCGASCLKLSSGSDQMQKCAEVCQKCAKICLEMAAA